MNSIEVLSFTIIMGGGGGGHVKKVSVSCLYLLMSYNCDYVYIYTSMTVLLDIIIS